MTRFHGISNEQATCLFGDVAWAPKAQRNGMGSPESTQGLYLPRR